MKAFEVLLFTVTVIAVSFNYIRCDSPLDDESVTDTYESAETTNATKESKSIGDQPKNVELKDTETELSKPETTDTQEASSKVTTKSNQSWNGHRGEDTTTVSNEEFPKDENREAHKNVTGRSLSESQTNHMRQLLEQVNSFRTLMKTDIKWIGSMSDLKLETIAVPAALFKKSFWVRLSDQTKIPIEDMKKMFGVDFDNVKMSEGNYMVDITEQQPEGDYINLGSLFDFLIRNNVNTRKLFICVGINPDVFTISFEDQIVTIFSHLFDLMKVPFKYGESYIEKMYREATDGVIRTLENYAQLSPSTYIDNKVQIYSKQAAAYADRTAMETTNEIASLKESSSKLASGAFDAVRSVLTLPAANCSKNNPCKRNIDLSSLNSVGVSTVEAYNSISPYATQAYDTSVQLVHKLQNQMGPSPTAYADLTSKTMYAMTMDESSKLMKIPYVLFFADGTFMDRVLTMPQLLVDVGGDYYKPFLMIADPLVRYMRYLFTGEWDGSLNAGVNIDVDIPAKILGSERPTEVEKTIGVDNPIRVERDAEPKTGIAKELQMVRDYDGKIPNGGYKHNITQKGNHNTIQGRLMNAPSFLMSAGGQLYSATANALTPFLETFQILVHSNDPYLVKIKSVEKTLDSAPAYVFPVASVVKAVYPIVDLLFGITYGEFGIVQIGLKVPMALSALGNGVFDLAYQTPVKIATSMFQYAKGDGGIMSMATLPYRPEFQPTDEGILPPDVPMVFGRSLKTNKTENKRARKGIVSVYEPAASFVSQISSGLLGNILNASKVKESGLINFKYDPVTSFIKLMLTPLAMFKLATDQHVFLQVMLGGQNPNKLLEIGINTQKILENDIDLTRLLVGGVMMLPESKRNLFGTPKNPDVQHLQKIGIDEQNLRKVNLNYARFLDDGLMSADEELLQKYDVNPFLLINRLMRNSVVNQFKFLNFGIDFKKFLSAGLRPDYFFAAGLSALETSVLNKYKINASSPESLNNIGINTLKLSAKNISVESLIKNGLEDFTESEAQQKFGINRKKLMKSIFAGLDNKTVVEIGIDVRKLIKSGYKPLNFILGIPELLKADQQMLIAHGINKKKLTDANIDFNVLMKHGVTSKMYGQFYRRGIHLQHLTLSVLSTWGLDELVADSDSPLSLTFNVATASTKIVTKPGVVGRSLNNVVNVSQFDPSGKYIKLLKSNLKKFTGEDTGEANTVILFNSYLKGNKNYQKLLNLGNVIRIIADRENATHITNPFNQKPSTLQELNSLYADVRPPTSSEKWLTEQQNNHRNPGFWG